MPLTESDIEREVASHGGLRLAAIDPLLPELTALPSGCGTTFVASTESGTTTGLAGCDHWTGEPGSLDLTWGAARRFKFTSLITGQDIAGALDQLITQWRDHLAEMPAAAQDDTAAMITWPSRDVEGIRVLQRHGLAPLAVIAARVSGSDHAGGMQPPAGIRIRRAGPADIDTVTRLGLELVRYDTLFGEVVERPETESGLRHGSAELLAGPEPWAWLAERGGSAVGLLAAERPEAATWIAPLARLAPVAYLQQMVVLPSERSTGIGALLVDRFHAQLAAAGVPLTLLHYSQVNPLSAPFWSQQGYRPLWTAWEARPARTLR
jgi:GNAT superfamily N-acetyltransferase